MDLVVSEEMSFENADGWTTDGRTTEDGYLLHTIISPVNLSSGDLTVYVFINTIYRAERKKNV